MGSTCFFREFVFNGLKISQKNVISATALLGSHLYSTCNTHCAGNPEYSRIQGRPRPVAPVSLRRKSPSATKRESTFSAFWKNVCRSALLR